MNSLKYLGITITSDISWKEHIKKICSNAEIKLRFLRRKLKLASKDAKLTAYLYLVRPALEYASVVWDPCETGLINMLERVQRRAARFILSRYSRTDSVTDMLQLLNLPSLAERRRLARLRFLFLLWKNHFKIDTYQYLVPLRGRTLRHTHEHNFRISQLHINAYANSFFPRTIKEWNALPTVVIQSDSVTQFEEKLKRVMS